MPKLFGKIPVPAFGINFTKSEYFAGACKKSFDDVDSDKDGALDFAELYVAILKLYDLLNATLPCRLRIPTNAEMKAMLQEFDMDQSGKLTFNEYLELCRHLAGGKNFWDSLFAKATGVLLLKLLVLPVAAMGIKEALKTVGVNKRFVNPVPTGVISFGLEAVAKKTTPLPL